jgi:hypothetical protein
MSRLSSCFCRVFASSSHAAASSSQPLLFLVTHCLLRSPSAQLQHVPDTQPPCASNVLRREPLCPTMGVYDHKAGKGEEAGLGSATIPPR